MSKWTIEKIKKQVKFGDFVSLYDDALNLRLFINASDSDILTITSLGANMLWGISELSEGNVKFFDRQGKEILPETEYKYVNFDSFGELCEAIINGDDVYNLNGQKIVTIHCMCMCNLDHIDHWKDTFFKRVEV